MASIVFGTNDASVVSVDTSGNKNWSFSANADVSASPTVYNNVVYIGTEAGKLRALNLSDGSIKWTFGPNENEMYSPTVDAKNNQIYCGGRGGDYKIYSVDLDSGTEKWNFSSGNFAWEMGAQFFDGSVYATDAMGQTLFSLNASDGSKQWEFTQAGDLRSCSPTEYNGTIFIGSQDNNVYAVNASDGSKQWEFTTGDQIFNSPTVVNDTVYIASQDDNVYALDSSSGNKQWEYAQASAFGYQSSPTVSDGNIYIADTDGVLHSIDSNGNQNWTFTSIQGLIQSSPTTNSNSVYIGDDDGIYSVDKSSGNQNWKYSVGRTVASSPTYVENGKSVGSRVALKTLGHIVSLPDPIQFSKDGRIGTVYVLVTYIAPDGTGLGKGSLTVTNTTRGNILFDELADTGEEGFYNPEDSKIFILKETTDSSHNLAGDEIKVEFDVTQSDTDGKFTFSFGNTIMSDHRHRPDPGIIESFNDSSLYPTNCDIIINGNSLGTSFGSGSEFEEIVDIKDKLNAGQVNTIEVTSDTQGHMIVFVEGDTYRQIVGDG